MPIDTNRPLGLTWMSEAGGLGRWLGRLLVLALVAVVAGCSSMNVDQFAGTQPGFRPDEYFLGRTKAYGIVEDRFGNLRRQMVVDIDGRLEGDTLVMHETFRWSDGQREERTWRFDRTGETTYEGVADQGVVGKAVAEVSGQAMRLRYDFDLPMGDSTWRVAFEDWFWLQEDGVLINRARISKFGVALAELHIFFVKDAAASAPAALETAAE